MCRLLAVLILVLPAFLATAAPVPTHLMPKPAPYFPTKAGTRWVYRYYGHAADEVGKDVTEVILSVTDSKTERGVKIAALGFVHEGEERASARYIVISSRGLVEGYLTASGNFVRRTEPLRVAAPPGTFWDDPQTGRIERSTFVGEEVIEVPAGRFRTLRVDTEFRYDTGEKRVWRRWYAPGVGMVKFEEPGKSKKILHSFTPGKD